MIVPRFSEQCMIDILSSPRVVCVGGDGMFTELMHGLLTRKMRDADIDHYTPTQRPQSPDLRIGVIPAGMGSTFFAFI